MSDRLPAGLEVAALRRRIEVEGGTAAILRKGDEERGVILLLIASRGQHVVCLERWTNLEGQSAWRRTGPKADAPFAEIQEFLVNRSRFDEDYWAIELDIPHAERFIAEMEPSG